MITIIGMTWKEMLRKRVMLLTLLMTLLFLIAFWFVAATFGKELNQVQAPTDSSDIAFLIRQFQTGAILLTLGFFFGSFVIAFLSIFSSFSVIAGEAEQGVLQALLPRPLRRWHWFLGRWIGFVSVGIAYAAILYLSILGITDFHAAIPGDLTALVTAFLLFALVIPMLVSVSMLGSCWFSALGNGVFMTMLFGAGWLGGMIEKVAGGLPLQNGAMKPLLTVSGLMSLAMPADSLHRRMLAELFSFSDIQNLVQLNRQLGPLGLFQIPSNAFLLYAGCYTLVALAAGMISFHRKNL